MTENKANSGDVGFVQLVHTPKGENYHRVNRRGMIEISTRKIISVENQFGARKV